MLLACLRGVREPLQRRRKSDLFGFISRPCPVALAGWALAAVQQLCRACFIAAVACACVVDERVSACRSVPAARAVAFVECMGTGVRGSWTAMQVIHAPPGQIGCDWAALCPLGIAIETTHRHGRVWTSCSWSAHGTNRPF